jgi:hypothetical protein
MTKWTYKTLKLITVDRVTNDQGTILKEPVAEWLNANFEFESPQAAAKAAAAYMVAHAAEGHMVVVSLEPAAEHKSTVDRLAEHTVMLDELKRQFTENGEMDLWNLIHRVDPNWINPWRKRGWMYGAESEDDGA